MRFFTTRLLIPLGWIVMVAPNSASAQQPDAAPPTESRSGYPDVRKEAADRSLFPDADETARNAVRPKTSRDANSATTSAARSGRGGRVNNQLLGQADADPLAIRISYRRAKTLAMERDPKLRTLLTQADTAATDNAKRHYLQVYYLQLFVEVRKIDSSPTMRSHLNELKKYAEQRYSPERRAVAGEDDLINGRGNGQRGRIR